MYNKVLKIIKKEIGEHATQDAIDNYNKLLSNKKIKEQFLTVAKDFDKHTTYNVLATNSKELKTIIVHFIAISIYYKSVDYVKDILANDVVHEFIAMHTSTPNEFYKHMFIFIKQIITVCNLHALEVYNVN